MSNESAPLTGPDLRSAGCAEADLADGAMLLGHSNGEPVVLARVGNEAFAVAAACTHYSGPLVEGLIVGDTVRCPLHHACFSLRTGAALRAPAFDPIACWRIEHIDGTVFVREKRADSAAVEPASSAPRPGARALRSVVIVGGGAAGFSAAAELRRNGFQGSLCMISADESPPCDRPNLSKDFLAGTAPPEWIPLRPPEFYAERNIDLVLESRVSGVDIAR